jgi:hypothetical protein
MASLSQIRAQVTNILRKAPGSRVIGIRTVNGWKGTSEIRVNDREYKVIHCVSELQIREALLDASSSDVPVVVVTNLEEGELGQDLVARFARRRLHSVEGWTILKDIFQAREIDPNLLQRSWLADFMMEILPAEGVPPVPSGVLDAETVWGVVLRRSLGFESSRPDAQDVLRWSLDAGNVARFTKLTPEVQSAIRGWICECAGKSATAVFDCADAGFGTDAFPVGLALCAVFADSTYPDLQAAAARLERYIGGKPLRHEVADAWAESARRLFDRLVATGADQLLLTFVDRSDQILKDVRADHFAWLSDFSRLGFEGRLGHFGRALSAALGSNISQVPDELRQLAESVRKHRWVDRFQARARQVEMAVRLLQWLAACGGDTGKERLQSFEEAANAYARGGGFVDWARQSFFHGDPVAAVSAAYSQLCEFVTERRQDQNRRFAELMASWMEAGCRAESVVLIENVLKTAVFPAAKLAPVLLIVIDGMSFAVYRELIEDISRNGWAELGQKGRTRGPAIAAMPSITEVCRRTLLSGKLTSGSGDDEKVGFATQADLVQVSKSGLPPMLFQKSDLTDAGGSSLSAELRREIASPKRRVVAAIVNAIDDHLLKGEQVAIPWTLQHIPVLNHLLAAAMESGRVVVMTSDHGHILDRQTTFRQSNAGERFRNFDGDVQPDEIRLSGSRVVLPEGKLIAPWSEKVRYGGKRNGYHGGASPQECVIPLTVLARPSAALEGYEAVPVYEPDWWAVGVVEEVPAAEPKVATPISVPRYSDEGQAELPFSGATGPRTWLDSLIESPVFTRQLGMAGRSAPATERIRRFLSALDERGGTILRQALGQKLGEPELRIPGLIAAVRRIMNVDGYPVLSVDDASGSVVLNRQLLEVQFEISQGESSNG